MADASGSAALDAFFCFQPLLKAVINCLQIRDCFNHLGIWLIVVDYVKINGLFNLNHYLLMNSVQIVTDVESEMCNLNTCCFLAFAKHPSWMWMDLVFLWLNDRNPFHMVKCFAQYLCTNFPYTSIGFSSRSKFSFNHCKG